MPADSPNPVALDDMRKLLLERRSELEDLLGNNDASTKPVTLDQQSVGRVSRVDAIQQQQMALANQQQAAELLKRIEFALRRIDDGSYGYCLDCGEPVAAARLRAQPWAGLCIDCQSAREAG